jgi:hypothetical protein
VELTWIIGRLGQVLQRPLFLTVIGFLVLLILGLFLDLCSGER